MGAYGSDDEKNTRTLKVGDGLLKLVYTGNPLALKAEERKLLEDLLVRIEQHVDKPADKA